MYGKKYSMEIEIVIYVLKKVINHIESDSYGNYFGICTILQYYTNEYGKKYIQEEILEPEFRQLPTYKSFAYDPLLGVYSNKSSPYPLMFHFENKSQRIEFLQKLINKLENKES